MKDHAPIIIKRIKKGHGGHHGGAWKVAFADFATAMMAFFLVMWLTSQNAAVKASVASYFKDPGLFDYEKSQGILPGGPPGVEPGQPPPPGPPPGASAQAMQQEKQVLAAAADNIKQELLQVKRFEVLRDQIEITVTTEGLRIELVERPGSSFFDSGSAVFLGESEQILIVVAHEVGALKNDIVIEGHTDSRPYADGGRYGNWELSVDRSNAARRIMERNGLHEGQVRSVRGYADTQLHLPDKPLDPRNRRVSIVVRSQAATALEKTVQSAVVGPEAVPVPSGP
jgi:chemotaxis protein MotB